MDRDKLLEAIERYLRDRNMSAAEFGKQAMGDIAFVYDLRVGREPRRKTIQRAVDWMRENSSQRAA